MAKCSKKNSLLLQSSIPSIESGIKTLLLVVQKEEAKQVDGKIL